MGGYRTNHHLFTGEAEASIATSEEDELVQLRVHRADGADTWITLTPDEALRLGEKLMNYGYAVKTNATHVLRRPAASDQP